MRRVAKGSASQPTEEQEQTAVVQYLELLKDQGKVLLFSAVPNNTYTRSWNQKRKQYAEGVRKGVPDLIIVTPSKVLFLEMKRERGGYPRPEQREWLEALNGKEVVSTWAGGFDEAKEKIDQVIGTERISDLLVGGEE
jgi:hypothetical protein